jgi:CubicO group peptidase (beta-lactamase class C family)
MSYILALALFLLTSVGLGAHHSIAGVYDSQKSVTVDGTITRFLFVNPHPFVEMDVLDAKRVTQRWRMELDNRGELAAIGVTAETLKPGDRVVVTGSAARSGGNALYVRKLVRPADGLEYEQVGSSPRIATPRRSSAAPAEAGHPDAAAIHDAALKLPRLRSLVVSRDGVVVFERYYNGATATRPANIKSASKSVISALVGIAIEQKLIPGVRAPITTWFPELARDPDPAKRQIAVEDLLTMRSGLESTSGRNYGAWVTSGNWVRAALARPMAAPPGVLMQYSTGSIHILSAIVTKASGRSTWQYANEALARPLGFTLAQWPRDPQGIYFGGNDMLMTPRQMLKFGELYLNEGRADGRQLVSAQWVKDSCKGREREFRPGGGGFDPRRGFDPLRDRQYGYGWWVYEIDGHDTCFAWGYGGQYVFVVPSLDMVIVSTSSPDVSEERRDHRRQLFDIVSRLFRPA